jgi:hypothetical protein
MNLEEQLRFASTQSAIDPPTRDLCRRAAEGIEALAGACKEFVRKVDAGEGRSTRSYAQMKAALEKIAQ